MKKILELSGEQFVSGIAPSSQIQNQGLFHKALGITVSEDIFGENDTESLLQAAALPTDITGSIIKDVPIAYTTDVAGVSNEYAYFWGDSGRLYRIDLTGGNNPTELTSSALGAAANGLFLIKHSDGTKKLYFFRVADIGYYGDILATPTLHTATYTTNIESTINHPVYKLFDRNYFANGHYIGTIDDNGSGGLTINPRALDFETNEGVTCLSDDGQYLVAGVTTNLASDSLTHGQTKVIFWDTNQSSWQREWPIPDASIFSIRKQGGSMIAVTSRGLFRFSFDYPPEPLVAFQPTANMPDPTYPTQYAADVVGGALLYGGNTRISSIGKLTPELPTARFQPYAGFSGNVTMVAANISTSYLLVGTAASKLYRVQSGSATRLTGISVETIYLDLKRWYQVGKIVVQFDGQLTTGDNISVQAAQDPSASFHTFGSAIYSSHGAIRSRELYGSLEARKLKLVINFVSGAVKIRNIQVWGDPLETPTHTRQ